jgi:hypothetical protein
VFASLLFSTLLVGDAGHDAISAAVLATAAAWIVTKALDLRGRDAEGAAATP